MAEHSTEYDGKGCPTIVWDGPYRFRCGIGAQVGVCAYHGKFADPVIPPVSQEAPMAERSSQETEIDSICAHPRATYASGCADCGAGPGFPWLTDTCPPNWCGPWRYDGTCVDCGKPRALPPGEDGGR